MDDIDDIIEQPISTMPVGLVAQLKDRNAFLDLAKFVFAVSDGGKSEMKKLKKAAGISD